MKLNTGLYYLKSAKKSMHKIDKMAQPCYVLGIVRVLPRVSREEAGMRILVVDNGGYELTRLLRKHGWDVFCASESRDALETARREKGLVAVIVAERVDSRFMDRSTLVRELSSLKREFMVFTLSAAEIAALPELLAPLASSRN